jgi:hypothetical protein
MPGDATPETVKKGDGDVQQRLTYPRIVPVGLNGFLGAVQRRLERNLKSRCLGV